MSRTTHRQAGFSLLAALVAVAITGVVAVAISHIMGNAFRSKASVTQSMDREALKKMLLQSVACPNTVSACTGAGDIVPLQRVKKDGSIAALSSKVGGYTLRAECTTDGLQVRAARLRADGSFAPDPLTGKSVTWTDSASLLFPSGVELCSSQSAKVACMSLGGTYSGGACTFPPPSPSATCTSIGGKMVGSACVTSVPKGTCAGGGPPTSIYLLTGCTHGDAGSGSGASSCGGYYVDVCAPAAPASVPTPAGSGGKG